MAFILDPVKSWFGYETKTTASSEPIASSAPLQSTGSSVAPAAVTSGPKTFTTTTDRPTLPTPSEYRLFAVVDRFENLGQKTLSFFSSAIETAQSELNQAIQELSDKVKAAAERARTAGTWSYLQDIASYILTALSGIIGVTLIATGGGTLLGGALIFSALATLFNLIMTKTDGWDQFAKMLASDNEDLRRALKQYLPIAVALIGGLTGLSGSAVTWFNSSLNFGQQAIVIAQSAFAIFQAGVSLGKGYSEANLIWANADQIATNVKKKLLEVEFRDLTDSLKGILQTLSHIQEQARSMINISTHSSQLAAQQV